MSRTLVAIAVATALAAAATGATATWGAFRATSPNADNRIVSGTVSLSDDDAGTAMFSLSAVNPGPRRCPA